MADRLVEFVRRHTEIGVPPLVPELRLHLADDVYQLWEATQREFDRPELPPPFWGFAWAGGQAVARHVLDHPEEVAGRAVLDLAAGSGLVALAAALAGAARVTANDIDPFAVAAIGENARLNGLTAAASGEDLLDTTPDAAVVLAGDVCYDRDMVARVMPFLRRAAQSGADVLVGDPGRAHLPRAEFDQVSVHQVRVPHALEGVHVRHTAVWRLRP
jgi:predicted nicotinamide N-methyase